MLSNEKMTEEEFINSFGISSEKAKELIVRLREIVNEEVRSVIKNADFYINPTDYWTNESLIDRFGSKALNKSDDADGYMNLYDFGKNYSEVEAFNNFISRKTLCAGNSNAVRACNYMDMKWDFDDQKNTDSEQKKVLWEKYKSIGVLTESEWKIICPNYGHGYQHLSGLYCDYCDYYTTCEFSK